MSILKAEKGFFENLTMGVVKTLERRQGICDIKLEEKSPTEKHMLQSWEQRFSCLMPEDLKSFYMSSNGMKLTWSVKMNDIRTPVGRLEMNPLGNLTRIGGVNPGSGDKNFPSLLDIDMDTEEDSSKETFQPRFDHRSRIFELDPCDGCGKVCLVYNNTKPGVPAQNAGMWFLDRALQWHFLADTFLSYFRLAVTYLGLPQWQYIFTDIGPSPHAKQWFNLYASNRLEPVSNLSALEDDTADIPPSAQLDVAKVFKGKVDKKKNLQSQGIKKKVSGPPQRGAPAFSKSTGPAGMAPKPTR